MIYDDGINNNDTNFKFYSAYPDSGVYRKLRHRRRRVRSQPATFYNTYLNTPINSSLDAASGVGSYDDNEEMDFSGMGAGTDQSQISTIPWYENIGKAVSSVFTPDNVKALAMYKLERQKNAINLERAKSGLPPLDIATATVGLSPDTKKFIMYGVGGLALLFILPKLLKG